jgi:hypothetical protein
VRLWEAESGRLLRSLPVPEDLTAFNLAFAPDGKYLFVGTSPLSCQREGEPDRQRPMADDFSFNQIDDILGDMVAWYGCAPLQGGLR